MTPIVAIMNDLDLYQENAMRTSAPYPVVEKSYAVFGLGLAGEAGEVVEMIKKHVGHGHPLDKEKLLKELGDVLWYVAAIARTADLDLSTIATANIEKLKKRYPEKFSNEASLNRAE